MSLQMSGWMSGSMSASHNPADLLTRYGLQSRMGNIADRIIPGRNSTDRSGSGLEQRLSVALANTARRMALYRINYASLDASVSRQRSEEVAPGVVRILPEASADIDAKCVHPASDILRRDLRLWFLCSGRRRFGS